MYVTKKRYVYAALALDACGMSAIDAFDMCVF